MGGPDLHRICIPLARFLHEFLIPARLRMLGMDIVAVAMAIAAFAILLGLIYAIDRI